MSRPINDAVDQEKHLAALFIKTLKARRAHSQALNTPAEHSLCEIKAELVSELFLAELAYIGQSESMARKEGICAGFTSRRDESYCYCPYDHDSQESKD